MLVNFLNLMLSCFRDCFTTSLFIIPFGLILVNGLFLLFKRLM